MKRFGSICLLLFIWSSGMSQKPGWQNLDLKEDSVFGISTEKAYKELIKGRSAAEVVVALIDMGVDTNHQDLRQILWKNPREIPGNGIDDDGNGYVDDIYGWNFLDMMNGKQDITGLAAKDKNFYDSLSYSPIPAAYQSGYQANRKAVKENRNERAKVSRLQADIILGTNVLDEVVKKIGKDEPGVDDFKKYSPENELENRICQLVIQTLPLYRTYKEYKQKNIEEPLEVLKYQLTDGLNIDTETTASILSKGDNDITGPFLLLPESSSYHGTSVAGILAADRNNDLGIRGVADHVKIMTLRVISFFQELKDEQLAKAIRYAVDNGAKVINISLSNSFSFRKSTVDEAVRYAMEKDVLIIKAAGNDGIDLDKSPDFPNRNYANNGQASAWITVGATSWKNDSSLVSDFSNYGKTSVDVFAPGDHLTSCTAGSGYGSASGTSVAAPVVSGLAALIREYYPELNATQVKEVILHSVTKVSQVVWVKNEKGTKVLLPFSELCKSGGIVNAFNALKMAARY